MSKKKLWTVIAIILVVAVTVTAFVIIQLGCENPLVGEWELIERIWYGEIEYAAPGEYVVFQPDGRGYWAISQRNSENFYFSWTTSGNFLSILDDENPINTIDTGSFREMIMRYRISEDRFYFYTYHVSGTISGNVYQRIR